MTSHNLPLLQYHTYISVIKAQQIKPVSSLTLPAEEGLTNRLVRNNRRYRLQSYIALSRYGVATMCCM